MKISFFLPTLKFGGIEANTIRLATSFIDSGYEIDLVVGNADGEYLKRLDKRINLINIKETKLIGMLIPLIKYLKKNQPDIIYTGGEGANIVVSIANLFAPKTKTIISIRTQLSIEYKEMSNKAKKIIFLVLSKVLYKKMDGIVAVSQGVAEDASKMLNLPLESIEVIYNPILENRMIELMNEEFDHPWIRQEDTDVILSVGRLVKQKDLLTLITAFKQVSRELPNAKLLLIGEGPMREEIIHKVNEFELQNKVELLGFIQNPYKYMKNADLFVLSSQWEGFGNVIVEALATGTPIVSTACPSGPTEILDDGRFGRLTEVGNGQSLADAIVKELQQNTSSSTKRVKRANEFTVEIAKDKYLYLMNTILKKR